MSALMRRRSAASTLLVCALAFAGCGGPPRPGQPRVGGAGCDLVPGMDPAGGTATAGDAQPVVVGMPEAVRPANAPVPRNAAERLVFAQLYEALVRVGCDGRIEPGLAAQWRAEDGGRSWVFTLRADARDWTGAPVTARDVAESWLASPVAPAQGSRAAEAPRLSAVTVLDGRTVRAQVTVPVPLHWFARPELAVRTAAEVGGWPAGTGPLHPETRFPGRGVLDRVVLRSAGTGAVEFRALPPDPRNAVDGGVDLLITRDPAVVDYAAASGAFEAVPLPWDRAYVLVSPGTAAGEPRVVLPPDSALRALARDAVRAEARPARELFAGAEACGEARVGPGATAGAGARRQPERVVLLYPPGDAVAQGLAERLVALAPEAGRAAAWLADAAPQLAAAGARARAGTAARDDDFAAMLRRGAGPAVVPVERAAGMDACGALDALRGAVPWLTNAQAHGAPTGETIGGQEGAPAPGADGPRVVPLIETRPVLLVRRGVAGVAVDGQGTLLLGRLHRTRGGAP